MMQSHTNSVILCLLSQDIGKMKILNIMLSRGLGGVQQVFLDYATMLGMNEINVVNVTSLYASINEKAKSQYMLPNLGNWDWISIIYLKHIIDKEKPDIIIAHGGRATKFAYYAKDQKRPLVGIIHSGKLKWVDKSDYIIALTNSTYNKACEAGVQASRLVVLPNAIDTSIRRYDPVHAILHNKITNKMPVIGAMARFVPKKGIDIFIQTISILKDRGVDFKAVIGGGGSEESNLRALVQKLGLQDKVSFLGWINDKKKFFEEIDIFCQPSIEEPFGVVILEAMLFDKPIIAADAEGPKEIITNMKDGILIPMGSATAMANAIDELLQDPILAGRLSDKAFLTVRQRYDMSVVGQRLTAYLQKIKISHDAKHNKTKVGTHNSHI